MCWSRDMASLGLYGAHGPWRLYKPTNYGNVLLLCFCTIVSKTRCVNYQQEARRVYARPYLHYSGAITRFFAPQWRLLHHSGMKFGVKTDGQLLQAKFLPQRCSGAVWYPQTENFKQVLNINAPHGCFLARFLRNFQRLWEVSCSVKDYNLGIRSRGSGVMKVLPRGCFSLHFPCLLTAKLYVES